MRVFLGNAPWRIEGSSGARLGVRAGTRWPFTMPAEPGQKIPGYLPFPFLLAYSAAVLERAKHKVLLIDAIAEGFREDEFIEKIRAFSPQLAILETSTPSINIDLAIAKRIKEEVKCRVALGGPHSTVMGKALLKEHRQLDYILCGEYEIISKNLANELGKKRPELKNVKGIMFRGAKSRIVVNAPQPLLKDIDSLPFPARHFLPMYNYCDAFAGLPRPDVQMWASRGCPFKCIFCLWPQVMYGGRNYRPRNPKKVVDEMEALVREYKFKSVYFDDDTFDIGKERILEMCREIRKRPPLKNIKWAIMARADTCDEEMLRAMKDAGLYALKFGVECASQEMLNKIGKRLDLGKARKNIEIAKSLGIKVHLTFTFGLPGETRESIQRTIDFSHKLNPDSVQFSITTPFPGTEYFDILEGQGNILTKDWGRYDGSLSCVMRTKNLSGKDLEEAYNKANASWKIKLFKKNMRRWPFLKQGIRHPIKTLAYLRDLLKYS